jgi:hypothetical protein
VAATAVAINPVPSLEDKILDFGDAVISAASNVSIILSSLVLLVVRIIIGGLVAVGGFARS